MPNISNARFNKLLAAEAKLDEMRKCKVAKKFAEKLLNNIGILLATKDFASWPDLAKEAFNAA